MTMSGFWQRMACIGLLALCLGAPPGVRAAESDSAAALLELPETLTPEQVDGILAGLTDAQVRQLLSGELRGRAERQAAGEQSGNGGLGVLLLRIRLGLERMADTLRRRGAQVAMGLSLVPGALATGIDRISGGRGLAGFLLQTAMLLGLLALGTAAYWGVRRLAAPVRGRIEAQAGESLFDRLCGAAFRSVFDLLAIAAFAVVAFGLAVLLFDHEGPDRTFVITYLTGALITHGAALVSRFLLAPYTPALRLAPLGDGAARFLFRWSVPMAGVAVFSWLTAGLLILTGMALEAHLMIVLITGAIMAVLLIVMILQARGAVAAAILGAGSAVVRGEAAPAETGDSDEPTPLRVQFAVTWHVFAILYVAVIWLLWAMSMLARGPSTIWAATASVGVILLFPILDRGFCHILQDMMGGGRAEAGAEAGATGPNTAGVMRRGLRVVLALGLGAIVLQLWGVNLSGEMGAQAQDALVEASFDAAVALLLAYVGWQLIKVGIDRRLVPREVNGVLVEPNARMKTLLPLARKFFVVVLVVMTVMLLLSALGVNIGPLLAGAGVVGIAIGFGAQTLVRDVMSGIFFLIEDAFRVGEYVEMGELRGEVEAISLRSLRLRHHRGPVHTIPFGELRSITNHNRDWVIYKMSFRVPFDTEIDKVKKLMKQVGREMMADPDLGPKLIEPLKSQGVTEIDDSAMIIRVKFMCLPREQFVLRREAYKRIKAAFEANGIEFARRKVEVHAAPSTPANEPAQAGAAAAVAAGSTTA